MGVNKILLSLNRLGAPSLFGNFNHEEEEKVLDYGQNRAGRCLGFGPGLRPRDKAVTDWVGVLRDAYPFFLWPPTARRPT